MKAAVVRAFGSPLAVEDVAAPEPGPEQVLVRLETSGLCHTDIHTANGDWEAEPTLPLVPGHEGAAHTVEETSIDRKAALADADIIVTGVPSRSFERIAASEIPPGAICVNFSTFANFEPDVRDKARIFVPRVGPMTVTMALRNTLRLYQNSRR